MARTLRIVSVTLITAGLVVLADAGATVVWQEPMSAFYSQLRQNAASGELDTVKEDFLDDPAVDRALRSRKREQAEDAAERQARKLAGIFADRVENGQPIGRIRIPSIGADYVVIEGTEESDLQRGPGHYDYTAFPGQGKTIGIAGHRTTYGAPFNKINEIDDGDEVILEMPYGTFTYRVTGHDIVDPTDVDIVDETGRERLVLTACHPLYSAAERYAVFAELERVEPATG
jgi:sortase A